MALIAYLLARRVRDQSVGVVAPALPQVFTPVQSFSPRCNGGEPVCVFDSLYESAVDLWNLCYAGLPIMIYQAR